MLLKHLSYGRFGLSTRKTIDRLSVFDHHHRGQAADTKLRRQHLLFIGVDHGRGDDPIETWQHHASQRSLDGYMQSLARYEEGIVGSEATWMAAMGPGINDRGLVTTGDDCLTNDRIAATLLEVLGLDYTDLNPDMGAPMREFLE